MSWKTVENDHFISRPFATISMISIKEYNPKVGSFEVILITIKHTTLISPIMATTYDHNPSTIKPISANYQSPIHSISSDVLSKINEIDLNLNRKCVQMRVKTYAIWFTCLWRENVATFLSFAVIFNVVYFV